MVDYPEPDPDAVGPAIMAWYALHNGLKGDPAAMVAWAADAIAAKLGAFGPGVINPLTAGQQARAIKEAKWLLGMIAEIFGRCELPAGDEARLAFRAVLKPHRGRPVKTNKFHPVSLAWWFAAKEVEDLIADGTPRQIAVGKVADRLGLKDYVVAGWLRDRRKSLERWSEELLSDEDKSADFS